MLLQQIPRYILIPNTIVCGLHIVQLPRTRTAALFFFPFESSDEIASVQTKFATNTVEKLSFESHAILTALILENVYAHPKPEYSFRRSFSR